VSDRYLNNRLSRRWPFRPYDGDSGPSAGDSLSEEQRRAAWRELAALLGDKGARKLFDQAIMGPAELRYLYQAAVSRGWGRKASTVLKDERDFALAHAVDILLARGVKEKTEAADLLEKHYGSINVKSDTIRKAHDRVQRIQLDADTIPGEPINAERPLPSIDWSRKPEDVTE